MLKVLQSVSKWLANYTSLFIILIAVLAFLIPDMFAWIQQGNRPSVILGIIMLTMGCTLTTDDFRILFSRPLDIFIGAVAQYTIMPFIAWMLARIFQLNPFMSAGIILVGCCPGGVSSNIMSFLCKGDVAFSVGMTTASTLLAPVMTPLLVYWLAGTSIEVDAWGMFLNILVVTLIPVAVGSLFNYLFGHRENFKDIQSVMPGISVICLALIVGGVIYQVHPQLLANGWSLFMLTLTVVVLVICWDIM